MGKLSVETNFFPCSPCCRVPKAKLMFPLLCTPTLVKSGEKEGKFNFVEY